jgi:hypothetical protein
MAAAAKAPGPADARIPCPLCGGLIHPIAGRCKHCKGDVSANQKQRPSAAAALPSLQATGPAAPYMGNGHVANGHTNGHAKHPANAHMAVPIAMRTEEASQPILPPRPTGRMEASGTSSPTTWKSWPVIVIGIAVIAIIVAVIIMVWPQSSAATNADSKTLAPPPAPERMDTNPLPPSGNGPSGQADPWKGGAAPDPAPSQPSPPTPSVPDIDDIQPPNDPDDSLANPFRGGGIQTQNLTAMLGAVLQHTCDRLASCPNAGDPTVKAMCDASKMMLPNTSALTCNAAKRCLSKIDSLPCDDIDASSTAGLDLIQTLPDCFEAVTRC